MQSMFMIGTALVYFTCGNNMPNQMLTHYFNVPMIQKEGQEAGGVEKWLETVVRPKVTLARFLLFNTILRLIPFYRLCKRYKRMARIVKKTEERVEKQLDVRNILRF